MPHQLTKPRVYSCALQAIEPIPGGAIKATLSSPTQTFSFIPGQYVRVTIPSLADTIERGNTRDFSISSAPNSNGDFTLIMRPSDSAFKQALVDLPPGTELLVQGPLGTFILPDDPSIPVILVAGGIGVTPFLSMIEDAVHQGSTRSIQLVYANRSEEHAVFLTELREMARTHASFSLIEHIGDLAIQDYEDDLADIPQAIWYICGPPRFVSAMLTAIPVEFSILEENLRIEEYPGYQKDLERYRVFPPLSQEVSALTQEEIYNPRTVDSILSSIEHGALVAVTDKQGSIQYVNDKFVEVSGYSRDELIGQNHRILKSGFHPPEFYQRLWNTISSGSSWVGEIKNRAKNGTYYWVDSVISPINDEHGHIEHYLAVRFLITPQKNLESSKTAMLNLLDDIEEEKTRIQHRQARDNAILSSIGDGISFLNKDGQVVFMNPSAQRMLDLVHSDLSNQDWQNLVHPQREDGTELETHDLPTYQVLSTNEQKTVKERTLFYRQSNGALFPVSVIASNVIVDGVVIGAVVAFRDKTEELSIDKAKTEFVSLASHQLRTPLSSINWYAEMLLDGDAGTLTTDQHDYVSQMYQANQRMVELINALLNVSRLELGTFVVEPTHIQIHDIIQSVLQELTPLATTKSIHITQELEPVPEFMADKNLLRMIVQNLLSNAIKYTPEQGSVSVHTALIKKGSSFGQRSMPQDMIAFSVQDTGLGIPKNQQDKIFTKLFRADNVRSSDTTGTGLGLYIVKSILTQVGGDIWFTSTEQKGTTFYATIPSEGMRSKTGSKTLS